MRTVKINRNLLLREDGKLFNVHTGEEFKPKSRNKKGYIMVRCKEYSSYMPSLHLVVMHFFGPPKPGPNYQVDHIDRNKENNDINNLRWTTPSENCLNKTNNRHIGHRACDFESRAEYNTDRVRSWRQRKRLKEANP